MEIKIKGLEDIAPAAKAFIEAMGSRRVFAFNGEMGAGKTTFIAEVCRQLGADDDSGSPTFSIVNEYRAADGSPIYHFDFYRLDSPEEALDMGAEDYFYSGYLCLIEWPDRIGTLLPEEAVEVDIRVMPDGSRVLAF
ncbi:MAG: tRNA (adenosine(37)-N6)-threonylcarbamoyltransferase complex ATPase subunit type 1 TsaE [Muribaculaceae bacterium]|nr:tRNA (adenosine(37)-N6)-threonylcarbamoyltransferase complex ATPase subunit type 1 TsaE [Muribaculaceae bacterium]MDE6534290.1 tRNA (adenosine(37)-N6)-threonylcarbamoyltransferase complex ATPase subunit type 1 TsaE [Muribaculaceae bacterium]